MMFLIIILSVNDTQKLIKLKGVNYEKENCSSTVMYGHGS